MERTLQDVLDRLDRLEGRPVLDVRTGPPPFILPEPPPMREQPIGSSWLEVIPDHPPSPPMAAPERESSSVDDIEYKIGMTGLLKGGAVIVILGLLYLVALGIKSGVITLTHQFIGEIVLCLGFIGIGQWKRGEREDFGQILTGIGSCGLYFSFTGAHVFKNLYEGETLVVLFLGWSLVNLVYSYLQSSRTFLVIGLVGGLIGSMLPMDKDLAQTTAILHFLVIVPTSFIIIKNRWNGLSALMWCLSVAALTPVFFSQEPWLVRMMAMYGSGLIACFVYAKTFEKSANDPYATFLPVVASITAIGGLLLDHRAFVSSSTGTNPQHGSHQVLVLSALLALMAYGLRSQKLAAGVLALTAVGIAAILAPIGLTRTPEAFTFLTISVALGVATVKFKSQTLSWMGWIVFGLSLVAYISPWSSDVFLATYETHFLIYAIFGAATQSWANQKLGQSSQAATLVASLLGLPMMLRISDIWVAPAWSGREERAMFVGLGVFTAYSLILGYRNKWSGFVGIAYAGVVATLIAYNLGGKYPAGVETLIVLYVGLMAVALPWIANRCEFPEINTQIGAAAGLVVFLVCRLSVIWLCDQGPLSLLNAVAVGLLGCAHFGALLTMRFGWSGTAVIGWGVALMSAVLAFFSNDGMMFETRRSEPFGMQMGLLLAAISAVLISGLASKRFDQQTKATEVACAVVILPLWTRVGHLLLTEVVGIKDAPAVTAAWIIYACITIGIGFRFNLQALRFFSFSVFGLTIAKVMLFDLSGLDPGIRVVILLFLGIAMIVGGYVYIRVKAREDSR